MTGISYEVGNGFKPPVKDITDTVMSAVVTAIESIQPHLRVQDIDDSYLIEDKQLIISVGKNAATYADAFEKRIRDLKEEAIVKVCVFQAEGYYASSQSIPSHWTYLSGSHPVPTEKTFNSVDQLLEDLSGIPDDFVVHFIATGGGSATFATPESGIPGDTYREIINRAIASGFNIAALNYIRSLIDRVKGGKLMHPLEDFRVYTWAISDVISDDPKIIAAGPTTPGIPVDYEAKGWLERTFVNLNIDVDINDLEKKLNEVHETYIRKIDQYKSRILTTRMDLLTAVEEELVKRNMEAIIADASIKGTVEQVAEQIQDLATSFEGVGSRVILWAGEPTITLTTNAMETGRGGRISSLCCIMADKIREKGNILFLGIATDGVDGTSPSSGYVISAQTAKQLEQFGDIKNLIFKKGNSGLALSAIDHGIDLTETEINLSDLYIVIIL